MRASFCLAALLPLAACATVPPPAPSEAELIRNAFDHPLLDTCDEIVCYYRRPRHFRIRAVTCAPAEPKPWDLTPMVECAYERQLMPGPPLLAITSLDDDSHPPPKPLGPWRQVKSSFMVHSEKHWSVMDDVAVEDEE